MTRTKRPSMLQQWTLNAAISAGACLLAAGAADAHKMQSNQAPLSGAMAADLQAPGPEIRREGGLAYVNGGIGIGGQQKTRDLGRDMNLQLVFAQAPGGNYMADVDVTIADRSGNTVLHLDSADPLLFAQLRPGAYEVTATTDGRSIKRAINVPASGQHTEYFHWQSGEVAHLNR